MRLTLIRWVLPVCLVIAFGLSWYDAPGGQIRACQMVLLGFFLLRAAVAVPAATRLVELGQAVVLASFILCNAVLDRAAGFGVETAFSALENRLLQGGLIALLLIPLLRPGRRFARPEDWRAARQGLLPLFGVTVFFMSYFHFAEERGPAMDLWLLTACTKFLILLPLYSSEVKIYRDLRVGPLSIFALLAFVILDPQQEMWPAMMAVCLGMTVLSALRPLCRTKMD